jgi:hypothetical protein
MKERNIFEILSVLDRNNKPMTSEDICSELCDLGLHLTDRMIRNYLQDFDKQGFTEHCGRGGRCITDLGRDELRHAFVYARSDYILTKLCRVITDANFDVNKKRGDVPVNLSFIKESEEKKAKRILAEVCATKLFPQLISFAYAGERICHKQVPEGMVGIAFPSSVVVDEIILKHGIYIDPSLLCCLIEFIDEKPVRCTNFSAVKDVSYDPIEMWINHGVGSVYAAAVRNRGEVMVEYAEFPYTARTQVIRLLEKTVAVFGGTVMVGGSEDKILGYPTQQGNTGLMIVCGESLPAALEENGIKTSTETIAGAINFKELEPIAPVRGEVILL